MSIGVKFKKLHPDAKMPFRKHQGDAGYDLFSVEDVWLGPNMVTSIGTGICLKMPQGYYCEIHTRSSHGAQGMRNHLGIIDEGYHGELTVLMFTKWGEHGTAHIHINKGDKIAQLIFKKRVEVDFIETTEDFESDRGVNGFGSTGK